MSGALRRSGQIEQLLRRESTAQDLAVIRWLTLGRAGDLFELRLHEEEDIGSSEFADVSAFPSVNPEDEYGEGIAVASGSDIDELLRLASARGAHAEWTLGRTLRL